ncbi:uncharacterized protein FIBRA_07072 [Fibroporia radiculosa]|uniref:PABS domain-containing protein n=1 Tax=Fibroporia radiculosa TaxID=599839 RepID=J4GDE7_9APHY|nr:uncharacterized protein FIBRA_07072 [Fibroporia radiculosa]CCM04878.1 predicted protein [Fibroporia radiculosa]
MLPAPANTSVLGNVISKLISVVTILGLSLVVFAYRRTLTPLYGTAPTDHHFNKIVWLACIAGSFAPALSASRATLAAGILLCIMPHTAYWLAVFSGRLGSPTWGPVLTHLTVIVPAIFLGFSIVKAVQQNVEQENANAPQQMITLPVAQTTIMTLQDLWPAVPYLKEASESQVLLYAGTLLLVVWAISPLLPTIPSVELPPIQLVEAPANVGSAKAIKSKGQHKKKSSMARSSVSVPIESKRHPLPSTPNSTSQSYGRLFVLPLLFVLTMTSLQSPTLPKPLLSVYNHPSYPLRILSSVPSRYSGVLVVGEALPPTEGQPIVGNLHSMRYLRAGHSLLGGTWMGSMATAGRERSDPAARDEAGEPLGESIYHAFMMQEAVRLAKRPDGNEHESALVIGLGIGTSASALLQNGVSTTVVEIDPAVYDAARRFFAFPELDPEKIVLRDARGWVRERKLMIENETSSEYTAQQDKQPLELYDMVLHDVFSGGGLPAHVFTQQFWNDTKHLMHPDGVLAVNFAGQLDSESSRAIILTLESVFGACRAFSDELNPDQEARSQYHNWVFFCTPSNSALTFRAPRTSDYLGSLQRRQIFSTLSQREIDLAPVRDGVSEKQRSQYILTDASNSLGKWQETEALHHWSIMREVLPDTIWETY